MRTRDELLADRELFQSRATATLLGLAIGDALGDLGRKDTYRQKYGIITNLYDDAMGTDDTEFALLTARALIDARGHLTSDAVTDAWKRYILAQGGVFQRAGRPLYGAVENLRRGLRPPLSGTDNVLNIDDGAAMRVTPIGIYCAGDPDTAARLAAIDARISHDRDGVWAAQAVAASISMALVDAPPEKVVAIGQTYIPQDSWLGRAMGRALAICQNTGTIERAWEQLHTELWTPVHSVSPEAIPQMYAIYLLTQGDFRKGLFWAANFGRDADTIAALVGALSAAGQGMKVIPSQWVEKVRTPAGISLKFAADIDIPTLAAELIALVYGEGEKDDGPA